MTSLSIKRLPLTLAVAGIAAFLAFPAQAEDRGGAAAVHAEKNMDGKHRKHKGDFISMDDSDITKVEGMSPAERKAFFNERRETFKKMSPEDKKALIKKRKEWFSSLPPEKKEALKERHKKIHAEMKAYKKAEFDKLSPEEQARVKKEREERKAKWKEKRGDKELHPRGESPDHDGPGND